MLLEKHPKRRQEHKRIIRNVGISFLSMVVALGLVCLYFYIRSEEVQEKYSTNMLRAYKRLELVNKLLENKEHTQSLIRTYTYAQEAAEKDRIRQELGHAYRSSEAILSELHNLMYETEQSHALHNIDQDLENYHAHVDSLLWITDNRQRDAATAYTREHLVPFYTRHQANLINLSHELTTSARERTNEFFPVFTSITDEYAFMLILAAICIISAAFAFHKISKRLNQENEMLSNEIAEREQLQKSLLEREEQYKRLFNQNPIPMLVYDQHTFKVLDVNEASEQEYGFSREEFLNMTVLDIRPPQEKQLFLQRIKQMDKHSDASSKDFTHRRKDGTTFKVRLKSHALPERGDMFPRLVASENIQEREEFIERLERREKQLREVSSSIPGAVYQFQIDEQQNMTLPFISDGVFKLYGITPEEVYRNPNLIFDAMDPNELEEVLQSIVASTQTFTPWMRDIKVWNKALNKWIWIQGHGLPSTKKGNVRIYNGTLIDITEQKEAEARLIASEANLRALLDSSPQAIYLLDKDLKIILFNAVAASEVKELQMRELTVGQSILDFTAEDRKQALINNHAKALGGETIKYEEAVGELWFETTFRPVLTQDKETIAVALNILNITEQRNVLTAIKESEAKLSRAQNLAKIGSWEHDLSRDILTMSDNMYAIYGLTPRSFNPTFNSLAAFLHDDDRERVLQLYHRAIETKEHVVSEHRIFLADGTVKHLHHIIEPLCNNEGKITKILGTTQDITDRKQKESEIIEAKNRFQSTLENIPEVIFSAKPNLQIFYVSPQCREITGYAEEEFMQDNLWPKIIHQEDIELLNYKLTNELLAGQRMQHEVRIITREGAIKWLTLRMSPKLDEKGRVVRIDSSAADVTERKMIEAKRIVLTEQLQMQNQNLQQFAYIVSHNLRAPIANILGLTSVYNRNQPDAAINQRVIENLAKSAQHLDSTIRDLNDILTIRGQFLDTFEHVSFEDLLQDILRSISMEIEKADVSIDFDFSETPYIVSLRSYIHSILLNLITNAIKYKSSERKPHICVKSSKQNDYICIAIADNGLGIDLSKEKGKLFGLYKRFHHHIEGRGLGLHLVKTQVELLGGKIEVESQVGVGTTFKVYLKHKLK
ncbi:PAS domain S-box protein [Pontibacter korlensis]|uniref:PAS domain S-box protein n=1 Tax=Pontibacter korlensis TaxID=400092 RepID=UPI00069808A7|nr:PAS domain S-box protein [Pontibacter korlensis]